MKRYLLLPGVFILVILLCAASTAQFNETSIETLMNQLENEPHRVDTPVSPASVPAIPPTPSPTPAPHPAQTPNPTPVISPTPTTTLVPTPLPDTPKPLTPQPKIISPSPSEWYKSADKGLKVPILMYHNLLEGSAPGDGLNVSAKAFEDQMMHLKAHGYCGIFFEQLYNHYANGAQLPENPVIITFDDGYKSNYTIGYPIISKYGLKACIFTITNAIGFQDCMDNEEIKDASASDLIEFQSHSMSHAYTLSSAKKEDIFKELTGSKQRLEAITSRKVSIFCYPYGRYSQNMVNELLSAGYLFAVTTKYGCASKIQNPFLLPRIRVHGSDSGKVLINKIEDLTGRRTKFTGIPEPTPEQIIEAPSEPTEEATPEPKEETITEPTQEPPPDATPEPEPSNNSDIELEPAPTEKAQEAS